MDPSQMLLPSAVVGLLAFCAVLLLSVGLYLHTKQNGTAEPTEAAIQWRAFRPTTSTAVGRSLYCWSNVLVNPILFAITLPLPWFSDALATWPEDLAEAIAWVSVLVRLGRVTLSVALHPEVGLVGHLLPRRRRWAASAILLLVLLAYMQAVLLLALAGLWISALLSLLGHRPRSLDARPNDQDDPARPASLLFMVEKEHSSDSDD